MSAAEGHSERRRWLDRPGNVDRVVRWLYAACAAVLAIDLLDVVGVLYHKHVHFGFEHWPGFFGIYGFVGCVALVLVAKVMRVFLKRPEGYYDHQ